MGGSGAGGGEGEEKECWWLAAAGDTGMGDAQQKGCMKKGEKIGREGRGGMRHVERRGVIERKKKRKFLSLFWLVSES